MMPDAIQCPNSLVAFFPASIYRACGTSTVLAGLLHTVDRDKLSAVQFLRNGAVRLTYKSSDDCELAVASGIQYGDVPLRVVAMEPKSRLIYLRDCPVEVPDSAVSGFFSSFGEIHSITHSEYQGMPGLRDGTRIVKMTLTKDVPGSVRVGGFDCRVWYRRQPPSCAICKKLGHYSKACHLNGICRRCFRSGHVARECRNAWGRPAAPPASEAEPSASDTAAPAAPPSTSVDTPPDEDPADADFNPEAEFESEDSSEMEAEFLSGDERVVISAPNPSRSPRRLRKRKRITCRRAGPDDMDVNEEYPDVRFFRTFREVWADQLTWEEIRANKFRPWGPCESPSQVPSSLSTPVPMSPVPSSASSDESVVATVVVDPQEVSQSLFSQEEQSQSVPPPERPPESPPDPVTPPSVALSDQSSEPVASPSVDQSPPPEPMVSLGEPPSVEPLPSQPPPPGASTSRVYCPALEGYVDFGCLSHEICYDRASFELNRFVMYHHRGCQRPAKTPSPFDALRGETVVIQGMHKIPPATFVPP